MDQTLPRPSNLLIAVSTLVVGVHLYLLSALVASIIVEPDPFAILGALFLVPIFGWIAVRQYRGTFRRMPSAAKATSVMMYIVGGFLLFGLVTSVGEVIAKGISLRLMTSILIPLLAIASAYIVAGRMNAQWARQLRAVMPSNPAPPNPSGFSLREFLLMASTVAAMTGLTAYFIRSATPQYAEHIDASTAPFGLPTGASDVSYCKGPRGTITYEFTVEEADFRQWVASGIGSIESVSAGIPLREITSPFVVTRYYGYSPDLHGPDTITVTSGLYYAWSKEDKAVYAAFDRTTHRAYFHAHYH